MKWVHKLYHNETGQAVIEYVLILIVSVGVILGALYQLNSAFRVWADSYFGDYLACLLESGEVPSLDGTGGVCVSDKFDITNGKPLVGKGVGDSGSDNSSSGSGSGNFGSGSAAANAAAGRANSFSAGHSRYNSSSPQQFSAGPGRSSAGSGEEAGVDTSAFGASEIGGYQQGKVIKIPLRRSEGYAGMYYRPDEDKKDKNKIAVPVAEQGVAQKSRTELMKIDRKLASAKAPDIEEFTFGNFLRYIIIAIIIIAILFFIGGQALQVTKSMD